MKILIFLIATVVFAESEADIEKELGVSPQLTLYKEGYVPGFIKSYDMGKVWKKNGLDIHGMTYWTIGDTGKNAKHSERFNPDSKFYQSAFGIYVVHKNDHKGLFGFDDKGNIVGDDVFKLAVSDQKSWLQAFGDPEPKADLNFKNASVSKMDLNGKEAWKILLEMETHSDVSAEADEKDTLMAYQFDNASLNKRLTAHLFHPHKEAWDKKVTARHPIVLRGFFICTPFYDQKATVCVYGTGVKFRDTQNRYISSFDDLKFDFIEMAQAVKFKSAQAVKAEEPKKEATKAETK